ncbi:hypothetical protein [Peribacillus sp. SCS-155]|uniref:hypothetical protein n=1 Tax=Peribacillus sedimenti TaxID=3115297 RepID=UPI003905DC80
MTSKAMQELLGVDQPDYGHLLNSMEIENMAGSVPSYVSGYSLRTEPIFEGNKVTI